MGNIYVQAVVVFTVIGICLFVIMLATWKFLDQ